MEAVNAGITYRHMYDCTHAEVAVLELIKPAMVALYLTGSPDIKWTTQDVVSLPSVKTWVRIDQGGAGSPKFNANVFDAEPGAYSIAGAIVATEKCTAPRPTIYCDRSDYRTIPKSYTKDIWLAAPGLTDGQAIDLAASDKRIVAVQNLWAKTYDRSIVIDPHWPNKAPTPPPPPPSNVIKAVISWDGNAGPTTRHAEIPRVAWDAIKWIPHSPD